MAEETLALRKTAVGNQACKPGNCRLEEGEPLRAGEQRAWLRALKGEFPKAQGFGV